LRNNSSDNPPALGWLTLNSFTASDKVLVVVSPGYFELDSLVQLGKTLEEVREYFNANLTLLGYLFTMSEPTINTSASLQILRQTYTERVLKTVIPRNTDLRDAHFQKQDIFSFAPRCKAANHVIIPFTNLGSEADLLPRWTRGQSRALSSVQLIVCWSIIS
jgi:chromosome partitioning protein